MCLQRARVPAARDAFEHMRADAVLILAKELQKAGKLPPTPVGCEDLFDRVVVSIDPETSLRAMPIVLKGMTERILPKLGFGVLENTTNIDLITSDNPVIWFVPYDDEERIRPYEMHPDLPLELLFPLSPKLLLYGSSQDVGRFDGHGLRYGKLVSTDGVERINRLLAKFAYSAIMARDAAPSKLAEQYAGVCPVMHTSAIPQENGQLVMLHMEFGKRRDKAKWTS